MTEEKVAEMVKKEIAEALGRSPAEISDSTWLRRDLGVESIDLIDLTFRFEKGFGRPLSEQEIFRTGHPGGDLTVGDVARALCAMLP